MFKSLYFARQPILDVHGRTYAYELLYRSSIEQSFAQITDDHSATAEVLVNSLNLKGLDNILGTAFAFININERFLLDEVILSVPKNKFVFEILESVKINDKVVNRIKELKEFGYRFALDDVDCTKEYILNFQPIFEYIDILKLDITLVQESNIENFLSLFKKFDFKILAEKVETQEQFDKYKKIGCHYFQGFFFAKPDIIENKRLDPEQILILNLIQELQKEHSINDITYKFEQNVALTLQLLRFINSAAFSFRTSIKSIRQAIILLGPNQLRNWLLLISYVNGSSFGDQGLKNPLLQLAQTRSNMMQTIVKAVYKDKCDNTILDKAAFVGLLSLVEALFQSPMKTILEELNVDDEIIQTLILHDNELGSVYRLVCAVEVFDIKSVDSLIKKLSLKKEDFTKAVQEAYEITESFISGITKTKEDI